jgi:predicted aldo/keto reductase-like oxidoreductase
MQYRKFGRLDWRVSSLGFGCMRLPTTDGISNGPNINEKEAISMIRYAIDQGVNYLDTAYVYHGGKGETLVGNALKNGYREKVKLATKCPVFMLQKPTDFDKYLNEQLKKLQVDHVDFYLFHGLEANRWKTVLDLKALSAAEAAIEDGRIRNLGFSFHDKYEVFKEIIDAYDKWTLCQIQYNYMDTKNQAGTRGLKYAASKGLAVVVMEPLRGGRLTNPPKSVQKVFDSFPNKRSPADWGLQWIWNQPEVSVALSGMSSMKQVEENIHSASNSRINSLGADELQLIERVKQKYTERTAIPCTKCGYCMPCENGIDIPGNLELYNDAIVYDDPGTARIRYTRFMNDKQRARACQQCRKCEEKCPQKIPISEWMPKVDSLLGEGKPK